MFLLVWLASTSRFVGIRCLYDFNIWSMFVWLIENIFCLNLSYSFSWFFGDTDKAQPVKTWLKNGSSVKTHIKLGLLKSFEHQHSPLLFHQYSSMFSLHSTENLGVRQARHDWACGLGRTNSTYLILCSLNRVWDSSVRVLGG